MVFPHQIRAQRKLVGIDLAIHHHGLVARWLLVAHIEHLVARPQVLLGGAMAFQAPLHLQRCVVEHERHSVDRAVAGIATDSLIDVNAVIEINEIRQIVNSCPYQRLAGAEALTHRFEQGRSGPDLRVAVHAGLGWRDPGEQRRLHRSMAIATVNAQATDVVLMAKGHGLWPHHFGVSDVGRALQLEHRPQQCRYQEYRPVNRGAGDCVRTAMKDLHQRSVQQGCRAPSPVQYGAVLSKQSQISVMSHTKTCDYSSSRRLAIASNNWTSTN